MARSLKPISTGPSIASNIGLDGAAQDIAVAEKLKPDSPMVVLVAARVADQRSDLDGARQIPRRETQRIPKESRLYQYLANVETRAGNLAQAEEVLTRGELALPEDRDLKWQLTEARIERLALEPGDGDPRYKKLLESIKQKIQELGALNYPKEKVGYLRAHMHFAAGHWDMAVGTPNAPGFEAITPQLIKTRPWSGGPRRCSRGATRNAARPKSCTRPTGEWPPPTPTSTEIRLRMASYLEAQGRPDEALEQYRLATDKSDKSKLAVDTKLAIARLLTQQNLLLPAARRNWQEVNSVLDEAESMAPDEPRVAQLRTEVLAGSGRMQDLPRCSTRPRRSSATASNSVSPAPATWRPGGGPISPRN